MVTALITSAATVVTNYAWPSAIMEKPIVAITMTSAGDSPAIAPR